MSNYFFFELFVLILVCFQITYGSICDTTWTSTSSSLQTPDYDYFNSIFVPFKLSNYLFIIGSTDSSPIIHYYNLNNYTSLLSSLYDKSDITFNEFESSLDAFALKSLNWNLLNNSSQLLSISNDTIYPFTAYPSTFFIVEESNDIYIVSPIPNVGSLQIPQLWKLHLNIKTSLLPSNEHSNHVDITYYWENIDDLLYPLSSSCVVYDKLRNVAYLFGGLDIETHAYSRQVQGYNLTSQSFISLSNMNTARRLSSCSFGSGSGTDYIYIFGGNHNNDEYLSIEIYDIMNDNFIEIYTENDDYSYNYPFFQYCTSATQFHKQNLIYIIGGLINSNLATSTISIFNPQNNSLEICSNTLQNDRGAATSISISDTIWTFGGYSFDNGKYVVDNSISIGISTNEFINDREEYNRSVTATGTPIIDNNDNKSDVGGGNQYELKLGLELSIIILVCVLIIIAFLYCLARHYIWNKRSKKRKYNVKNGKYTNAMSVRLVKQDTNSTRGSGSNNLSDIDNISIYKTPSRSTIGTTKSTDTDTLTSSASSSSSSSSAEMINSSSSALTSSFAVLNTNHKPQKRSGTDATMQYHNVPNTSQSHYIPITPIANALNTPSHASSKMAKKRLKSDKKLNSQPLMYSEYNNEVIQWLRDDVDLAVYIDTFFENGFDRMCFVENITESDLIQMGIQKTRHRIRILQQIKKHNSTLKKRSHRKRNYRKKNKSICATLNVSKSLNNDYKKHILGSGSGPGQYRTCTPSAKSSRSTLKSDHNQSVSVSKSFNSEDLFVPKSHDGDGDNDNNGNTQRNGEKDTSLSSSKSLIKKFKIRDLNDGSALFTALKPANYGIDKHFRALTNESNIGSVSHAAQLGDSDDTDDNDDHNDGLDNANADIDEKWLKKTDLVYLKYAKNPKNPKKNRRKRIRKKHKHKHKKNKLSDASHSQSQSSSVVSTISNGTGNRACSSRRTSLNAMNLNSSHRKSSTVIIHQPKSLKRQSLPVNMTSIISNNKWKKGISNVAVGADQKRKDTGGSMSTFTLGTGSGDDNDDGDCDNSNDDIDIDIHRDYSITPGPDFNNNSNMDQASIHSAMKAAFTTLGVSVSGDNNNDNKKQKQHKKHKQKHKKHVRHSKHKKTKTMSSSVSGIWDSPPNDEENNEGIQFNDGLHSTNRVPIFKHTTQ